MPSSYHYLHTYMYMYTTITLEHFSPFDIIPISITYTDKSGSRHAHLYVYYYDTLKPNQAPLRYAYLYMHTYTYYIDPYTIPSKQLILSASTFTAGRVIPGSLIRQTMWLPFREFMCA